MGIDYSGNIISISDEEGNKYQLEHLDTFEFEGRIYMAFFPADLDIDDPGYGLLFMRVEEENGEDFLANLEDEEEERVYDFYMESIYEDDEDLPEE